MATLADIIKDKVGFPDNVAINLGNGVTFTVGQLREMNTADAKRISEAEAKIAAAHAENEKKQLDAANLFVAMTEAKEAMQKGDWNHPSLKLVFGNGQPPNLPGSPANQNDPFAVLDRYETDALLGPVVKALKYQNNQYQDALKQITALQGVNKQMATAYINGSLSDRYDRLVPDDQQEKYPLKGLIEAAVSNGWTAVDGTPDIKKAFKAAKAPDDNAAREAQIRADERKKVLEEARGGSSDGVLHLPRPDSGHFGLDVHNRSGQAPKAFASLDEAFAAAAKDSSVWAGDSQA